MAENRRHRQKSVYTCEAETTPGLEFIAETELLRLGNVQIEDRHNGEIRFRYTGNLNTLPKLKTVQSVSLVQGYSIPRPRGLLDNTNIRSFLQQIDSVRHLLPHATYKTFYLAAAGSDSSIMQRIKETVSQETGLYPSDDKGDLWIRIRPGREGGWETLVRLSPRPLVTRAWRVCNMEGALNAATAHAMIMLAQPRPEDVYLNLGCGSGTLLIERLSHSSCHLAIGIDSEFTHLQCAEKNVRASGYRSEITLLNGDIKSIPIQSRTVTALCADLPFGRLIGSHKENTSLYPALLAEAARIAQKGANFVLISHEIRLLESLFRQQQYWTVNQAIRINLRGLHPRIYVLQRR